MTVIRQAIIALLLAAVPCLAGWQDDLGYTQLKAELGASTPTGAGVEVTQVEGDYITAGHYLPDPSYFEFAGKTFTDKTGGGATSLHATIVGLYYYGTSTGFAPGIPLVDCYRVDGWLTDGMLRALQPYPPAFERRRIQNHSWVYDFTPDSTNVDVLRRVDEMIDRDGVVVAAAVNNFVVSDPTTRLMPKVVSSAYNCITVALTSGNSSYGPTRVEQAGRAKPDIASTTDTPLTSYSTPTVAATAALLLETEGKLGTLANLPVREQRSAQALLTKALLMGGTVKSADWRKGFATPTTDGSVPLDYRYGAGTLNVYNSYHLLVAGQFGSSATTLRPVRGWDYAHAAAGASYYYFQVPTGQVASKLSVMLVWNRKIAVPPDLDRDDDVDSDDLAVFQACRTGAQQGPFSAGCDDSDLDSDGDVDQSDFGLFQACLSGHNKLAQVSCRGSLVPTLADFDLKLYVADGFAVGSLRDKSVSRIDNVEHIYLENLPAGNYAIELTADRAWPYAITWDATLAPAQ